MTVVYGMLMSGIVGITPLQNLPGIVNICYNLSRKLTKHGHDVTIITTNYKYDLDYAQSLENVEIIPFRRVTHLGLFLYSPGMRRWLKSNISNYDVSTCITSDLTRIISSANTQGNLMPPILFNRMAHCPGLLRERV